MPVADGEDVLVGQPGVLFKADRVPVELGGVGPAEGGEKHLRKKNKNEAYKLLGESTYQ